MYPVCLSNVKRGDYFRMKNSECAPLWVRSDYDRSIKKYECYKYDDVNHFKNIKGNQIVYIS